MVEPVRISPEDMQELRWCYRHLEHPSLAVRLSNLVGTPIEEGMKLLPDNWYQRLDAVLTFSINKVLQASIVSMNRLPPHPVNRHIHKVMAVGTGAVGGFFGPLTLLAELPMTTMLMLRAIADIAHQQGEDMQASETRMACAQVFALGGRTKEDQAAESGYFGLRTMLGFHFSSSLLNLPGHNHPVAPAGVELVRAIAARFGIVVSDKASAQMIPIIGAISGACLNLVFMQHFQDIAKGHFTVRRLERRYGSAHIKKTYQYIARQEQKASGSYSDLEGW